MAKKKSKSSKSKKQAIALENYIELGAEYASNKREIERLTDINTNLAPELRSLAKKAGLDKTKVQPEVTDGLLLETRFNTAEKYDTDRLYKWLKAKKLTKVSKACFTTEKVLKFDKSAFDKLEEAGKIPDVEELEEGENPIYWVEDLTPSLYVNDSPEAKAAEKAAKDRKKRKGKKT